MASNFSAKFSRPYRTVHLIAATLAVVALLVLLLEKGWRLSLDPFYLRVAIDLYKIVVFMFALEYGLALLARRPWARLWRGMLA
ncbi:MAG: hypothetical protein ACE5ID_02715, partial [Acidobacteriota bacterium]